MKPVITVGISYRNPGPYFRLALQSVFAQTFEDWELILLDDGSTDGSADMAHSIRDSRVRSLSDGHSRGLNARLNELTSLAQAPYFARMDADDVLHPERLKEVTLPWIRL